MPKIRAIHPSFWSDTTLAECSMGARLFYIGLWNFADDAGVFEWHDRLLKSQIFPLENDVDVPAFLAELSGNGRIGKFTHNNREYGLILNFEKYQKPDSRYLKFTIGDLKHVKSIYHGVAPASARGAPSTDGDSDGDVVIDGEVKSGSAKKSLTDDEAGRRFREILVKHQWCDDHYAAKTWDQGRALRGDDRAEFMRKVRLVIATVGGRPTFAKKLYHEIAGFVNDRGAMQSKLSPQEKKAREIFREETGQSLDEA